MSDPGPKLYFGAVSIFVTVCYLASGSRHDPIPASGTSYLGRVKPAPLGRPVAEQTPNRLGQIGDEGPADVLAAPTLAGVHVRSLARENFTDVTAAKALDREHFHGALDRPPRVLASPSNE